MIKTESITHFFVKAEAISYSNLYKEEDFITCDNFYRFRRTPWNVGKFNCFFYSSIGPNGFGISFYKSSYHELDESFAEGDWVYLGGVPTSEIHKK